MAKERSDRGDLTALARGLLYALLALCVGALVWLAWITSKQRSTRPRTFSTPSATAPPPPPLNNENLQASQLPSDEGYSPSSHLPVGHSDQRRYEPGRACPHAREGVPEANWSGMGKRVHLLPAEASKEGPGGVVARQAFPAQEVA